MSFIDAYRSDTGESVRIPEGWLGHPVLGDGFQKTKPNTSAKPVEDQQSAGKPAKKEKEG